MPVAKEEAAQTAGVRTVRIVFDLPGDDIGSPEARALLEKARAALAAGGVSDIVRSGFGMGTLEIVVRVAAERPAEYCRGVIIRELPEAKFRVEDGIERSRL